jgi:hypothetical protein
MPPIRSVFAPHELIEESPGLLGGPSRIELIGLAAKLGYHSICKQLRLMLLSKDPERISGASGASIGSLSHRSIKGVQGSSVARNTVLSATVAVGRTDDAMNLTRTVIEEHWRASEDGDTEAEHTIYAVDAILDYPQSGERFRGRTIIAAQRGGHPAERHFTVLRISGNGNLWVSECIITYDGVPTYSVSIMEFARELVVHETQYFADTFSGPAWRTALAEPMPGRQFERA